MSHVTLKTLRGDKTKQSVLISENPWPIRLKQSVINQ